MSTAVHIPPAFRQVRLIVYDLDGTLYQDTEHFDFYARALADRIDDPKRGKALLKEFGDVLAGRHVLRFGRVYDTSRDLILDVNETGKALQVWDWQGNSLPADRIATLYPGRINPDQVALLSIGDLWWPPQALAIHYGLGRESIRSAFWETRAFMASDDFQITCVPGLRETITGLRERDVHQVVVSNSFDSAGWEILKTLGLEQAFERVVFDARKPEQTLPIFRELSRDYALPFRRILSVGDNYWNEILPVETLGCPTLFLDPYGYEDGGAWDVRVRSTKEAIPYLQAVGREGGEEAKGEPARQAIPGPTREVQKAERESISPGNHRP